MAGKTLYLGLNPPKDEEGIVHFPVIHIKTFPVETPSIIKMMSDWEAYTHLVLTSKSAVKAVDSYCSHFDCQREGKVGIAVGKATAKEMESCGFSVDHIAQREQAEGILEVLECLELGEASILWPHSALSRNVLSDYFLKKKLHVKDVVVYDTLPVDTDLANAPDLEQFKKIIFTSPSTVDAFLGIYGTLNVVPELIAIGPITRDRLCQLH
ncbi:MAG: uroporphyrinogen-III synthase [Chlamydiota bacterium]